jgi:hypothetical protein
MFKLNLMSKKISFYITALISLLAPFAVKAGDYGLGTAAGQTDLPQTSSGEIGIATVLGNFAGAALALSGSIFLFLVVYGGILIMTAAGKQPQIDKGKNVIVWAIIGALILGGAYAITTLVFSVVGAQ